MTFVWGLLTVAVIIFFMIMAWRTMVAVERTAKAAEEMAKRSRNDDET